MLQLLYFLTVLPSEYMVRFIKTVAIYKQHGGIKGKRNQEEKSWQDEPNTWCTNASSTPRGKGSSLRATVKIPTILTFIDIPLGQEANQ